MLDPDPPCRQQKDRHLLQALNRSCILLVLVQEVPHSIFLAEKRLLEHKARQRQLYVLYCLCQGDTESRIRHYYSSCIHTEKGQRDGLFPQQLCSVTPTGSSSWSGISTLQHKSELLPHPGKANNSALSQK